MTTDKVRIEIHHKCYEKTRRDLYPDGLWLATIPHPVNSSIMGENWVYPDRDNWIDITLPEEIGYYTKYRVFITYKDKWEAYMLPVDNIAPDGTWQTRNLYELQVTVY